MSPIPDDALDDRLAFVGTSGSGKTHAACTAVERLLNDGARVVVVDPLDVWWGLRLKADGKAPGFPVVIFGGDRGDLPITEAAGGLIGETVAGMTDSCVVSLSTLGSKAAERRFMLAFLERLYRSATGEPFHVIFDEADLWAPQRSSEPQLQNLMEQIVRRGRVKGFLPWLITQRPAVISKDVLSQADGLIAMKLTSSQDRDAIGNWIEGQADKAGEKRMLARLPQLARGTGVVWIPGRGVLDEGKFPLRTTFDSSRTPKRGEPIRTAALRPLDIGALKARLAAVEAQTAANDPKALKAEIAQLRGGGKAAPADDRSLAAARAAGEAEGFRLGYAKGLRDGRAEVRAAVAAFLETAGEAQPAAVPAPRTVTKVVAARDLRRNASALPNAAADLSGPERTLLAALAWWRAVGQDRPSRAMVCAIAGWRVTSGHAKNVTGSLRTKGFVTYPSDKRIALTPEGIAVAEQPKETGRSLPDFVRETLSNPQRQVFDELLRSRHGLDRARLCEAIGWSESSGHAKNVLGSMRSLEIVEYPTPGSVKLVDWIFG